MHTHGNLTASYLWQPGELARRMLGERPSPVPPTRELWPPPHQQLSISTLQIAYQLDDTYARRAATLPPQSYAPTDAYVPTSEPYPSTLETYSPTTVPIERTRSRPRLCTIGTNTDPPPTILSRLRDLFKRPEEPPIGHPPPGRLTAVPRETALDIKEDESRARRAISGIKRAISGAKYRIAPGNEAVDSPKISYDMPKPGDRMATTFGARETRKWCKLPSKATCEKKLRGVGSWCADQRPRRPTRREPHQPRLQITQV
ncbi:hypothetical protein O0L34_g6029 [Tuta absoluta]|nr:hypothetical protein O0L34_g6029 [Tuta absoluta]